MFLSGDNSGDIVKGNLGSTESEEDQFFGFRSEEPQVGTRAIDQFRKGVVADRAAGFSQELKSFSLCFCGLILIILRQSDEGFDRT